MADRNANKPDGEYKVGNLHRKRQKTREDKMGVYLSLEGKSEFS